MTQEIPGNGLHLPTLAIAGFRGIREISIRRLGRVTLLTGNNGAGKTTILEAVRLFAAHGSQSALSSLLCDRDEAAADALFFGRTLSGRRIRIGPVASAHQLTVEEVALTEEQGSLIGGPKGPIEIPCRSLGSGQLADDEIARLWEAVALTDDEAAVVNALRMVVGDGVHRVAVVAGHPRYRHRTRSIVGFEGDSAPVPLKSLGDGAVRVFEVALALANSRHGLLTIDGAENGIHHSLQKRFWSMVLETAEANNVQVLATTHSRDCVEGFARAATECDHIDSALARINRRNGETWAVEYSAKDMWIAAEQGIEVR